MSPIVSRIVRWISSSACVVTSPIDRKSTRLNSIHGYISYAVFCLKKKKQAGAGPPARAIATHASPANALGDADAAGCSLRQAAYRLYELSFPTRRSSD